jgi:hypothetical protein
MRKIEPRTGPVDGPDANPRGPLMIPTSPLLTPDESLDSREIGPVFVNDRLNTPGDVGDWWLDLGYIDLPA